MPPTGVALLVIGAADRFARARERDDIPEMRAALDEKTGPPEACFAATRHRDRSHAHAD